MAAAAAPQTKEQLLQLIFVSEQSSRFDDMVDAIRNLVTLNNGVLNSDERNWLAIAYKGKMLSCRSAWRILWNIEQRAITEATATTEIKLQVIQNYREGVQTELVNICQEILETINEVLLSRTEDVEAKVFYLKTKGDYYRYMAEVASPDDHSSVVELSEEAYQAAYDMAADGDQIKPTHALRLGLALNFSVFFYEALNSVDRARPMAKKALDDAVAELQGKEPDSDVAQLLQLLRDNLEMWAAEVATP